MKRLSFAEGIERLRSQRRVVSSRIPLVRKVQFKRRRLYFGRTMKYDAKRGISFPGAYEESRFNNATMETIINTHHVNYASLFQKVLKSAKQRAEKPVIVEFGPGTGLAVNEVAKTCPEADVFGFADTASKSWLKHKKVKYIQEPAELFRKYFGENSINFLYSAIGLAHAERFDSTVRGILPTIRPGGYLITDFFSQTGSAFKGEKWHTEGNKVFEIETKPCYSGNVPDPAFMQVLIFHRIR